MGVVIILIPVGKTAEEMVSKFEAVAEVMCATLNEPIGLVEPVAH